MALNRCPTHRSRHGSMRLRSAQAGSRERDLARLRRDTRRAMSRENVELVERVYEAFSRGDPAAALSYFDPEVVMDASHRVDGRIGHGHQELTAILIQWLGTWDGWREEVEETRDLGDRVLVISTQRGVGKEAGSSGSTASQCSTRSRAARSLAGRSTT